MSVAAVILRGCYGFFRCLIGEGLQPSCNLGALLGELLDSARHHEEKMERTIGTCSLCGGEVTLPTVWWGVVPPVPTCSRCGATAASQGPVIEMEKPRWENNTTTNKIVWKTNTNTGQ